MTIPYTLTSNIGVMCRGISDIVCLGYNTVCTTSGGTDEYPFLVSTLMNGDVPFIGDAMIGLSPNPETSIRSFGEQLILQKSIDKHIVAITTSNITFGAFDQARSLEWLDLKFDSSLKNWAFPT